MKEKQQLYCFIDTETTGVHIHENHCIHQIAAILVDMDAGEEIDTFEIKFRPDDDVIEAAATGALEKCKETKDTLRARSISSSEAYYQFQDFISKYVNRFDKKDKLHFVAYNAKFDSDFVRAWAERNGDVYYGSFFWHPALCVLQRFAIWSRSVRQHILNCQLGTVCKLCFIDFNEENAHDALYDVRKTIELWNKLEKFGG